VTCHPAFTASLQVSCPMKPAAPVIKSVFFMSIFPFFCLFLQM
jgi:hypothetical protein